MQFPVYNPIATPSNSQTVVRHGGGGGRDEGLGATPLPRGAAAASGNGGGGGGVTRRMFSRPRLENGGRKSVLSHMLFNKL